MREIVLGHHETTAGFFIESMNYSRPKVAADAAQISRMMQQRVNQCTRTDACPRVNAHPSRLVDNQHMLILEKNRQRKVLRLQVNRFGCWLRNGDFVPRADELLGAAVRAVQ